MGKSSNSRQKLAFRAARRRVLEPGIRKNLVETVKSLYESAGLAPPTADDYKPEDLTQKPGSWSGVEVVPNFVESDKGRVLNSVHRKKQDVDMEESDEKEGLMSLQDKVREAELKRAWREEGRMEVIARGKRQRRYNHGTKKRGKSKRRHPKNKPSLKF